MSHVSIDACSAESAEPCVPVCCHATCVAASLAGFGSVGGDDIPGAQAGGIDIGTMEQSYFVVGGDLDSFSGREFEFEYVVFPFGEHVNDWMLSKHCIFKAADIGGDAGVPVSPSVYSGGMEAVIELF